MPTQFMSKIKNALHTEGSVKECVSCQPVFIGHNFNYCRSNQKVI